MRDHAPERPVNEQSVLEMLDDPSLPEWSGPDSQDDSLVTAARYLRHPRAMGATRGA